MTNKNIKKWGLCLCALGMFAALTVSCENGNQEFDDYEGGTTVYFAYQSPVRTIVLGDDEYDTSLDKAHKCQIQATFGGSYNGSDGSVQIAVDNALADHLTFADGTPVKAMPQNYYTLSTNQLLFGGTFKGVADVQLTDAFFSDPDAVKNTYVIPVVMVSQNGFGSILTGSKKDEGSGVRTDASAWNVLPKDYVLYCVKYQNKYSGYWLTNGTTNIENIEKAGNVQIKTRSLNSSTYTVSYQGKAVKYVRDANGAIVTDANGQQQTETVTGTYTATMLLTFDGSEKCTITSLTPEAQITGTGSWGDNSEKKAWGNKDRDGMELSYTVSFGKDELGNELKWSTHEKLVWLRSGVKFEEFSPVYVK